MFLFVGVGVHIGLPNMLGANCLIVFKFLHTTPLGGLDRCAFGGTVLWSTFGSVLWPY